MKILELHLRNIASIEQVDIDFENSPGLIDPDTEKAAQMFLIYGDTGSGKSILLDGITMALFKETPRIESRKNKTNNSFVDANGNLTRITSVEQYTRMGITEKDECYSEVVFIGNDSITYRAKLELGYNRPIKGQNKGQLCYKSRHKLKIGDEDWIEGIQCADIIKNAIGMNFDQFCRMAMLAQGMFSSFLCGERKDREYILERLTQTEIFTKYGEAIKRIYDSKKRARITAEDVLKKIETIPLPDSEVTRLNEEVKAEEEKLKTATIKKEQLSERKRLVENISIESRRSDDAKKTLESLEKTSSSNEFRMMETLCKDWDNTDEERKTLSLLQTNKNTIKSTLPQKEQLQARFEQMAADLENRKTEYNESREKQESLNEWIDKRKKSEPMYLAAQTTLANLKQYDKDRKDAAQLHDEKEKAEKERPTLKTALDEAGKRKETVESETKELQTKIDNLTTERNKLDPKQLTEELHNLTKRKQAYQKLRTDYDNWNGEKKELEQFRQKLGELKELLKGKNKQLEEAQKAYQKAYEEYNSATNRWITINASLDDKLDDLRQKIAAGNADICPLCGQKIATTILTKEEFKTLTSPYEKEQQRAKELYEEAQKQQEKATAEVGSTQGEKKNLEEQIDKLTSKISTAADAFKNRMKLADIDADIDAVDDVNNAISSQISRINDKEKELNEKSSRLKELQDKIDKLLIDKGKVDKRLKEATTDLATVNEKSNQNEEKIRELTEKVKNADTDLTESADKLDGVLSVYFPNWRNDIDDTYEKLKTEANEYLENKKLYDKNDTNLRIQKENIKNFTLTKEQILKNFPQWSAAPLCETQFNNLQNAWNELSAQSSSVFSTIDNCNKIIKKCEKDLEDWELTSGKSIDYLTTLSEKSSEVVKARQIISNHYGNIKSQKDTIVNASIAIDENRKKLNLRDDDPLLDIIIIGNDLAECEKQIKDSTTLIAEDKTKLDKDKDARKEIEEQQGVLERAKKDFDHWDALNRRFGDGRLRTLVQSHILQPLLNNANIYLSRITDRYTLTCNEENEQLSIFVLDRFNRNEVRSATILSGGEIFMISLALSLALSSLNRPDFNVNILFIDEGFGTLDQKCLNSVMSTLARLGEISGQSDRRVGIISHREELLCIPNKIKLERFGEGRSKVDIVYEP